MLFLITFGALVYLVWTRWDALKQYYDEPNFKLKMGIIAVMGIGFCTPLALICFGIYLYNRDLLNFDL